MLYTGKSAVDQVFSPVAMKLPNNVVQNRATFYYAHCTWAREDEGLVKNPPLVDEDAEGALNKASSTTQSVVEDFLLGLQVVSPVAAHDYTMQWERIIRNKHVWGLQPLRW